MEVTGSAIVPKGFSSSTDRMGVTTYTEYTLYQPGNDPRNVALPELGSSQVIRPNGDGSYMVEDTRYFAEGETTVTEYSSCLSTEPIDTHPDFLSTIGGKLGEEKNGAIFDPETGVFQRFRSDSKYAGVTSYLCFSGARTDTTTKPGDDPDDADDVGTIDDDMLCVAVCSTARDGIVTTRREWRQAGPRGWDPVIYGKN